MNWLYIPAFIFAPRLAFAVGIVHIGYLLVA